MLYSHSKENEKLAQFSIFVDHALKGDGQYASVVNHVLLETHQFTLGKKSLYDIDRNSLVIITLLADVDPDYFKSLSGDPANYDLTTYLYLSKLMSTLPQQIVS